MNNNQMKALKAGTAFVAYLVLAAIILTVGVGGDIQGWLLGGAVLVAIGIAMGAERLVETRWKAV